MSAESFHAEDTTVTLSPQKGGVKAKQSIFSLSPHDHPDTILRKLGVIRQKVTFSKGFGKRYARYDPSVEKWIDQETNEEHLSDPSRGNGDYIDTVPGGVILVAGELESESANPYDCTVTELQELEALLKVKFSGENESLEKCRKRVQGIIERKRSSEDFDDQQLLITNLGDEQDGKFLNDAEVQQYVRQYVVRSIPSAAVDVGAVVMTASSSDGKLVSLLSQGIGVASSTHDVNALHITEKLSANRTTFATVAKFGGLSDPVDLAFLADSMAIELNKGSTSSRDDHPGRFLNVHPPTRRKAIPVTVIAFGGVNEKTCNALKMQLYVASLRQWPIFLVEGSGGLTDDIVKILRTLRDPSVSQERQETLRHKLDSQTFEIINNGKLFVVGKGQIVDAFSSSLKFSIRGDSTLLHAWKEYGAWNGAGEEYRFIYESLLLLLVTLGVFSTGLSVFQTVMQVVWVNETKDNSNATVVGRVYSGLNLVVIFLPLLIQLMQSVFNKINSGPKWAALSWAAENCLREIYLARVQGMEYSSASLEALSQVKVDGELRRSGRVVTRQELLSKQLEKLSKELRLNVANTLIRPYSQEESIPPKEMRFLGDDGMSDLSSDDYVRLRIVPRLEMYKREVVHVSNVRVLLETCLHLFNTAGTVLGALATYEFLPNTNLQAWVAFTTSVVSALTRVEHWMLYEWKQRKYTQTYMKLASVMSWWSSRGKQVASEKVMSELCTRAEAAIKEELAEFSQQLRTAADSIKKANDEELYGEKDPSEMLQDLLSGINSLGGDRSGKDQSKREMMRFVKELPLELITAENIEAAASDPSSFIGRQMKQLLNELNHEFGDVVGAHQRRVDELRAKVEQFLEVASSFRDIQHLVTDGLGCISMPSIDNLTRFGFAKLLSRPLRDLIETPHKRTRYLAALEASLEESGGVLRLQQLRDAASSVDRDCVRPEMSAIPARLLLETARLALQEEAASQFSEALASAGISPQEITPRRGKLADTIQALRPLSFLPWRVMESSEILLLIDDNKVRSTLKNNVSESKLRSLLKRIESFYRIHSHSLAVEADVLNEAVMMDMYNEILGTPEGRIISSSMRAQMRDLTVSPTLLSQMDLVRIFADSESGAIPDEGVNALGAQSIIASISRHVGDLSQSVLAEYVRVLSRDLPANSCLVAAAWYSAAALRSPFMKSIDAFTNAGFAFIRSVEPIFVVSKRIDQLASFALSVSQSEILQSRKEQLLKRLLGSTGAKDLVDILRTVEGDGLKQLLCATHSLMGVSYVGEIFDHLSFEMHTFDPARALNYEEKILLLSRLNEFARDDIIQIMSKEDILNRLALKPLNRKLKDLKDYQLRDLMIRLRTSMFPLFAEALKTRFVNLIASKSREVRSRAELMGPLHFYILAHCLGRMDVATFLFLESYTKSQFHGMFGDPQPKRSEWLRIIPDSNVQQTVVDLDLNFDEIKEFCRESAKYCEDSILLEALERFAIDFADDSDMVDALEVAFGSNVDGQQSRDCFFASLVVLVANGFTSLTVVEAMSKVASNELLSSVQKILDQSQLVEKLDGNAVTVINAREILRPEHRPQFQGSESRFRQRMKDIHKRVNIALSERYPVFLSSMLSSVMVQCTMFVFNEVARIHKSQDLRQVFDKLHARVHLPFFAICRWDLIISVINVSQHPKRDEEALEKALKEVLRSPTQAIKKGTTPSTVPLSDLSPRRSEAKSQGAEEFSEMERTIDDLREMPRDDTIQVLQILMSVLTKTRIGNLFYLLAKSDVSVVGESHPVFSLREIVTSQLLGVANAITPQVAIHKAELYEKFCAFKEKSFAAKSPASKEDVFKAFVFDDSLAKHAATSWEESTLCEFFAYMRTRAKFIRETVSSSGQVRVVDQYVTHRADLVSQEREQQGSLLKTAKRITTTLVSLSRIVSHKNDLVQAPSLMAAKTETIEPAENSRNEVYSPAALLDEMIGRVPDPSM
ncbi:transmembrane protein, putative [Bodo saltans]|uniref:Transmembrane protein, putative n=1 Tax=Bodo saltans TaxID=75058 RepID=A0A0S4J6H1_BODSA|nr:transmembrane protein, putative [Bodo saltans]|eukprot:CUG85892.1 transmembrane protein, putative [Bodo saltans]